ncbi:MAG: WYL domain-containing protein [Elusimicrobiota bacterium]|nr:WYL domain-containing protein [Elusimicrobiota bacterium]
MYQKDSGDKKYFRVLNILNRLNEGPVRIADLSAEFGVCERSIQRDIERINLTGFHLDTSQKGLYSFSSGVSLKNFNLTSEQLSMLVLMREVAGGLGGTITDAFDKIFDRATAPGAGDSPFYSVGSRALNPLTRKFYEDIVFAIENHKKLKVRYAATEGVTERVLLPVKILASENFFYMMAARDGEKAVQFRKYRVDRIKRLEILPEEFAPPSQELIKRTIGTATTIWGVNDGKKTRIILRAEGAAADFLQSKEILPRQKVSKPGKDGSVTVKAEIHHNMEVVPLVLHWMPEITIIEPSELREAAKKSIDAYLEKQKIYSLSCR